MAAESKESEPQVKQPEAPTEKAEKVLDTDAEHKRLEAEKKKKDKDKGESKPKAADSPMRVLSRRAIEIAESGGATLGSAITAPQAERVKSLLGQQPMQKLGSPTLKSLLAYAQGGRQQGREDLAEGPSEKLKELSRQSGDRRIWPRKVAALTLALHEQKQGSTIPGTKRKEVKAEEETAST